MKSPVGIAMWVLLSIWIAVLCIVNPVMTVPWWLLNIAGMMFIFWLAWHNTIQGYSRKTKHGEWKIDMEANHFIASILVIFGNLIYKLISFVAKRIRSVNIPEIKIQEQKRVATDTLDIMSVHPKLTRRPMSVVLGYDYRSRPIVVDLSEDHTLIGASTKGGKTSLIRSILIQILCKPESTRPEVWIVDLKSDIEDGLMKFRNVFTYVDEAADAIDMLRVLTIRIRDRNKDKIDRRRPVLLVIDEVSGLTDANADRDVMREGRRYLSRLSEKARSANVFLIIATQHPRYDTLPKSIANNLMRKIAFRVASQSQLEVILEHKPNASLPKRPGDFLLWEGGDLRKGRTILSKLSEIDRVLMAQATHEEEPIHLFYRYLAAGKNVGDHVSGQGRAYEDNREEEWCTQPFVREAFKRLVDLGILSEPKKGSSSTLQVEFLAGVNLLKESA